MQISEEQAQEVTIHERRIEQAREAMGATVSQLQHELSPGTLAGTAGMAVKDATVGGTGRLFGKLAERAKANPIPATLMGASLAWIWLTGRKNVKRKVFSYSRGVNEGGVNSIKQAGAQLSSTASQVGDQVSSSAGDLADGVSSRVNEAADQLAETVGDVAQTARSGMQEVGLQAQRAQSSFQEALEENPLGVALVAAGLGALIATAVPTTPAEQRFMKPVGDELSDQAMSIGKRVGQVAERAQDAAREEAHRQNLT